jgi:hypothetical protein
MNWQERYTVLRDLEDHASDAVLREAQAGLEREAKALADGFRTRPFPPQNLQSDAPGARTRRDELRQYVWAESAARNLRDILEGSRDVALSVQPNADTLAGLTPSEREAVMHQLGDDDLAAVARQARRLQTNAARELQSANGVRQRFREASVLGKIGMAWDSSAPPDRLTRRASDLTTLHARLAQVEGFARRELESRGKPLPPEGDHD